MIGPLEKRIAILQSKIDLACLYLIKLQRFHERGSAAYLLCDEALKGLGFGTPDGDGKEKIESRHVRKDS